MIDKFGCVSETAHYDKETPKRVHIKRLMRNIWGFLSNTFGMPNYKTGLIIVTEPEHPRY